MKNITVKLMSCALAASIMFSIASCANKGPSDTEGSRSGKKITADTPWYETKPVDIEIDLDDSREVEYTYPTLAGADEKYIVVLTTGYYRMPTDIDWENYDYNQYVIALVTVLDKESGKNIMNIDLTDNLESTDYIETASYDDGTVTAVYGGYDMNTYETTHKEVDFDCQTGEITGTRSYAGGDGSIEHTFNVGDYKIETMMDWANQEASYILYVHDPDGNKKTVEIREKGKNFYDITVILPLEADKALVPVSTDGGFVYFELDLKTGNLTQKDEKEYEWLDLTGIYEPYISNDGMIYFTASTGIKKIDIKKKTTEEIFNYSWCGLNRNRLTNLSIAEMNDDSFILCGQDYSYQAYADETESRFVMYEFNKAAKNPHAGKTILELYSAYGYTEDKISEAILRFNETNGKYFIEVTDRYSSVNENIWNADMESEDDYQRLSLDADSKMSNQLAMDIMNGNGPDILMNVSDYGQLNNSAYLADLSPYVSNLGPDRYFTNVIDAARVDGKLYNLPVCFMIDGIQTDPKYAGASGVGFTTDEYEIFLTETLNGNDIITSGQAYYFATLFTMMSDKFIVDGKADFSGPEFAQLADFVKDNVRANARSWDELNEENIAYDVTYAVGATVKADSAYDQPAIASYCYGLTTYFMQLVELNGGTAILGYPSTDGRGPAVEPYVSVAVSARSCDVDACGEFVKMLMSDEIQMDLAMNDNFVISRDAFRAGAERAVEYYNGSGGDNMFGYDYNTGEAVSNRYKFSEKNIADIETIILSCSNMHSPDADINLILVEEMPAYFTGQKSLSDVISIAQERVQKVLNERG